MNNLDNFLKQNHTVRLSNGVEVEKPERYHDFYFIGDDLVAVPDDYHGSTKDIEEYHLLTKSIKVPNWMKFWEALDSSFDHHDSEIVRNIQSEFKLRLSKPPRIEEFVAIGKNGEVLEELEGYQEWIDDNKYSGMGCFISFKEYQTAQDNVIYEGWEVTHNDSAQTIIGTGEKRIVFQNDGTIFMINEYSDTIPIKTTDDLNREVQLYMKIK